MTHLALNGARGINGVSRNPRSGVRGTGGRSLARSAAGRESRRLRANGVHVPTFLSQTWSRYFDEKLGTQWRERMSDADVWRGLEAVPDGEFWQIAQAFKVRMLTGVRARLAREYAVKGLSPMQLRHITRLLDPARPQRAHAGLRAALRHLQARVACCCVIGRDSRAW